MRLPWGQSVTRYRIEGKFRLRSVKDVMEKYQYIMQSNAAIFVHGQKEIEY